MVPRDGGANRERYASTMTDQPGSETPASEPATTVTAPAEVVRSIKGFIGHEGGSAKAVLQPVGEAGVRITLVGEKGGILGDRVVVDSATAEAVVAAIPNLEQAEWDRQLTTDTNVLPKHWRKMAGWVAHQFIYPKARNSAII